MKHYSPNFAHDSFPLLPLSVSFLNALVHAIYMDDNLELMGDSKNNNTTWFYV